MDSLEEMFLKIHSVTGEEDLELLVTKFIQGEYEHTHTQTQICKLIHRDTTTVTKVCKGTSIVSLFF